MFGVSENIDDTAEAGEQVQDPAREGAGVSRGDSGFKAPASQEELDRIIQKRLERERARFSDYEDVKARAEKAAELESANAELSKRVAAFEAAKARSELVQKVAEAHGVDAAILGEMRGDSEDDLNAQAERLVERLKPVGPVIPGQAKSPENPSADESRQFMRKLLGKEA